MSPPNSFTSPQLFPLPFFEIPDYQKIHSGRRRQRQARRHHNLLLANECISALNGLWKGNLQSPRVQSQSSLGAGAEACRNNILECCRLARRRGLIPRVDADCPKNPFLYNPFSSLFSCQMNYEIGNAGGW